MPRSHDSWKTERPGFMGGEREGEGIVSEYPPVESLFASLTWDAAGLRAK